MTNVYENDTIKGKFLGYFSFGVLVKELLFPCGLFLSDIHIGILVSWPIKMILNFDIVLFLYFDIDKKF